MILYEYEGKELLKKAGIVVPKSLLVTEDSISSLQKDTFPTPCVLKAQVLSGKRADVGGIVMVEESSDISHQLSDLFKKTINGEKVEKINN